MTKSLEFFGALANIEHGLEKNTVLETLVNDIEGFNLYKQVYEPNVIYASVNWKGVLTNTASVAAIASLLWNIYIDKVEPKITPEASPKPMLLIHIKDADGGWGNLTIHGNYSDKEIFIKEFTEKVERLRESEKKDERILERMESTERWIRIK